MHRGAFMRQQQEKDTMNIRVVMRECERMDNEVLPEIGTKKRPY
jgi:hypothetical protein